MLSRHTREEKCYRDINVKCVRNVLLGLPVSSLILVQIYSIYMPCNYREENNYFVFALYSVNIFGIDYAESMKRINDILCVASLAINL